MKYLSLLIVLFCGQAMAVQLPPAWRLVDITSTPHEGYFMPMGELQFNTFNGRVRMPVKIINVDTLKSRYRIVELDPNQCGFVEATMYVEQYPRGELVTKFSVRNGDIGVYTEMRRIACRGLFQNPESPTIKWDTATPYNPTIKIGK